MDLKKLVKKGLVIALIGTFAISLVGCKEKKNL